MLLCVRGGVTQRDQAIRARDRIQRAGALVLGVLINALEPEPGGYYDKPYAYEYGRAGVARAKTSRNRAPCRPVETPEPGVIELHFHCLPGLDDGPADWDEAVALCRAAANEGTTRIVATPHVLRGDWINEDVAARDELIVRLNELLGGRPAVLPGCEYFFSTEGVALLDHGGPRSLDRAESVALPAGRIAGRGGSRECGAVFHEFRVGGLTPVIAHPERHAAFRREPEQTRASRRAGRPVPGDGRKPPRRLRWAGRAGLARSFFAAGPDSLRRLRRAQSGSPPASSGRGAGARAPALGRRGRDRPVRGQSGSAHRLGADPMVLLPFGGGGLMAVGSPGLTPRVSARRHPLLGAGFLVLAVIAGAVFGRGLVVRRGAGRLLSELGLASRPEVGESLSLCDGADEAAAFASETALAELGPDAVSSGASERYEARGKRGLDSARDLAMIAAGERPGWAPYRLLLARAGYAVWDLQARPDAASTQSVDGGLSSRRSRRSRSGADLDVGGRRAASPPGRVCPRASVRKQFRYFGMLSFRRHTSGRPSRGLRGYSGQEHGSYCPPPPDL